MKKEYKIVHAYADDVLLLARYRVSLESRLRFMNEFLGFTVIAFNSNKCTTFRYSRKNGSYITPVVLYEGLEAHTLTWIDGNDMFRYLGIPLGENKSGKLNYTRDLFIKVEKLLDRITGSEIDISHVVNEIKIFILPKFDYLFHNTEMPLECKDGMNIKIRKDVNSLIRGQAISK
jgi:hypothetical protein